MGYGKAMTIPVSHVAQLHTNAGKREHMGSPSQRIRSQAISMWVNKAACNGISCKTNTKLIGCETAMWTKIPGSIIYAAVNVTSDILSFSMHNHFTPIEWIYHSLHADRNWHKWIHARTRPNAETSPLECTAGGRILDARREELFRSANIPRLSTSAVVRVELEVRMWGNGK